MGLEGISERARAERELYGDRLPPGQRVTRKWPVFTLGEVPPIETAAWRLDIDGLVERELTLDWDAFMAIPQSASIADMHCVTRWSRFDNHWEGVASYTLADMAGVQGGATAVLVRCYGGYSTNLPLDDFAAQGVLLAHRHDGEPLAAEHGGPVRLVVPHRYGWKSAKWVRRVEFVSEDEPGTWEQLGYHNNGDPWREERYREGAPASGWKTGRGKTTAIEGGG